MAMIDDVRIGLSASPKTLPAYLLYDAAGSALYERITSLPEYYLTRVERSILEANAHDIIRRARGGCQAPLTIVELGAGSATKTELLLRATVDLQGACTYVPVDISEAALEEATRRLRASIAGLTVRPMLGSHEFAFDAIRHLPRPVLATFIGSSIGNYDDGEGAELLGGLSRALDGGSWLLLGTDLRKCPARLLAAYDDSAGVTASFNKNILARINRELSGHFDLDRFQHTARWNEGASRIEMHLVSLVEQDVEIEGLSLRSHFELGETIHTESSIKYDRARARHLLSRGGFEEHTTFVDREELFGVHLARVACQVNARVPRPCARPWPEAAAHGDKMDLRTKRPDPPRRATT